MKPPNPPEEYAPSRATLLSECGLYYKFLADGAYLKELRVGQIVYDGFCVDCEQDSTFRREQNHHYYNHDTSVFQGMQTYVVETYCTRLPIHKQFFHCVVYGDGDNATVEKIGQYPSIEDLRGKDLKKYKAVLSAEYFRELRTASGLFAHGIGIGSFVYLRRIFEKLIWQYKEQYEAANGQISSFVTMRMEEKISALSSSLPPSLVKNNSIYGIISKGIHELSENECRSFFPAVRAAVIAMLEQDLEAKKKREADEALAKELQAISASLSGR